METNETFDELDSLYKGVSGCQKCELCKLENNKRKMLPRIGRKNYLIVSQNPSYFHKPEDTYVWGGLNNLPLQRIEKFLTDYELLLSDFTITNIVKCCFKDNVVPDNVDEIVAKCSHWIIREISIIKPRFILAMGTLAGDYFKLKPGDRSFWNFIPTYASYHPSYVARTQTQDEFFKILENAIKGEKSR